MRLLLLVMLQIILNTCAAADEPSRKIKLPGYTIDMAVSPDGKHVAVAPKTDPVTM